jgi:HlyD family secretion protein
MKRRRLLTIIAGIIVLIVVVIVINLSFRGNRYDTAIPVRTHAVAKGTLADRVSGNGTFKPVSAVTVTAQVSGEVESIRVHESDKVAKGDVLLALRDDDYALTAQRMRASLDSTRNSVRQSLVTLRAQYRSASSTYADAQRTLEKNKDLYSSKSISEEAYQKSEDFAENSRVNLQSVTEQLNLRAGLPLDSDPPLDPKEDEKIVARSPEVEQALLSLRAAEDNVRRCTVTAPISGTVTDVRPSVGDVVAPSSPLVRIETLDAMIAEIQIDEVDIGKLRLGQKAEVTSDSLLGETLSGTVTAIAPTVTSLGSTRASLVEIAITAKELSLRSGASCSAKISTNVKTDSLLIPLAAFVTEDNTSYVYLLAPTGKKNASKADVYQLSKKKVEIGTSDVNYVEAVSGLAEGDLIVAGSLNLMRDGIMVTAKPE